MTPLKLLLSVFFLFSTLRSSLAASFTWQKVPNPAAEQKQEVVSMVINTGGTIFVATTGATSSLVFRSTTEGKTWEMLSLPVGGTITFFLSKENILYAATSHGLFLSTDQGEHWTPFGTFGDHAVFTMLADAETLYVGGDDGLLISRDHGITWEHSFSGQSISAIIKSSDGSVYMAFYLYKDNNVIAGDSNGIYRSTDNGLTWTQTGCVNKTVVSLARTAKGTLLAGVWKSWTDGQIFRSDDQGITWNGSNGYDVVYSILPISGDTVFSSGIFAGARRSLDDGKTWISQNDGVSDDRSSVLALHPNGTLFDGTVSGDIYKSTLPVISFVESANTEKTAFSLYPQPVSDHITVVFPAFAHARILLYDITGIVVKMDEHDAAEGERYNLNVADMPIGVYYYQIEMGSRTIRGAMTIVR